MITLRFALGLALMTVLVSSYIRLAESGVGCDDWPECYGQYQNNVSAHGINVLTDQGKDSPHRMARIGHRLLTSVLGVIVLSLFIIAWRSKYRALIGRGVPTTMLLLTVILASIGQIHPPQPLPILILANFSGGMLLVALVYYLYARLRSDARYRPVLASGINNARLVRWVRAGLLLMLLQLIWGGWASANYAGASCGDLFKCGAIALENSQVNNVDLIHFNTLKLDQHGRVMAGSAMQLIQKIHHGLAIFLVFYFVVLAVWLMRAEPKLKKVCLMLLALLTAQVLLGLSALAFQLPLAVMVAHNLLAALLLVLLISLNLKVSASPLSKPL